MQKPKVLTQEEKDELHKLYRAAGDVIKVINKYCRIKKNDPSKTEFCNKRIMAKNLELEDLEFEMQRVWGFSQNANYHTWWLKGEYCTCPKMDNMDPAFYGGGKIITQGCPVHDIKPVENRSLLSTVQNWWHSLVDRCSFRSTKH